MTAATVVAATVVAELEAVAGRLADLVPLAADAAAWDGAARARVLGLLDRLPGLAAGVRSPVLLAAQAQAATVGNEREFVDARARLTGRTRFEAAREVETAHALETLGSVRAAVVENVMPVGHAQVLARTLAEGGERVAALLTDAGTQSQLVELSRGTDSREFARSVAVLVAAHDPDRLDDERAAVRRARFLTLAHTADGTFVKGRLDPLAGQTLARALDATGHRADADRTGDQARADALTALARHALTAGLRPSGTPGGAPPGPRTTTDRGSDGEDGALTAAGHALTRHETAPAGETALADGAATAPTAQVCLLVPAETWLDVRRRAEQREGTLASTAGTTGTTGTPGTTGTTGTTRSGRGAGQRASDPEVIGGGTPLLELDVLAGTPGGARQASPPSPAGRQRQPDDAAADASRPGEPRAALPTPGSLAVVPFTTASPSGVVAATTASAVVPPAVSDDGTVLSRTELAAALCDCAMTRVVMTSAGLPLDVGRSRRLFTPAQRLAVVARDRQCAWNGCSTVARYCEVHHIRWWHRHAGRSDLENAVLLCSHHHHQVHERELSVARLAPSGAGAGFSATRYVYRDARGRVANGPDVDRGGG